VVEVVEAAQPRRLRPGRAGRVRNPFRSLANALLDLAWRHVGLPRAAREARADLIHHPLPARSLGAPCPQVVTVHDVAFARMPQAFDLGWRLLAGRGHRRGVRRAAAVICVSESTANDAVELLGADRARAVVSPHGPGQELPEVPRRSPRHFLYVGDDEPRKNLDGLLAAYAAYRVTRDHPFDLVLAGAAAARAEGGGVRGVESPSPERLAELYAASVALVHPSLHEGFGLTLVEAMRAGTPVLAVRNPGTEEVCREAALLVRPEALDDALRRMHADGALRERLIERGSDRVRAYSWDACAAGHEGAYTLALRPREGPRLDTMRAGRNHTA
jgi:glycosyltransferase involved in cell wall biosynthesis